MDTRLLPAPKQVDLEAAGQADGLAFAFGLDATRPIVLISGDFGPVISVGTDI